MKSSTAGEILGRFAGNIVACYLDTKTRCTRAGLHHDEADGGWVNEWIGP